MAIELPDKKDQINFPAIMEDYQREQEEIQQFQEEQARLLSRPTISNIGKIGATAYGTTLLGREALRYALQPKLQDIGAKASIIIDNYYNPKLGAWEKIKMSADHFMNNEAEEINKMVKDYGEELGITKKTKIKNKLISVAKRDFDMDIRHIKKGGRPVNNMGQFRAAMDEDMAIRRLGLRLDENPSLRGAFGKAKRNLRAENAWKNLNDILYDGKITEKRQRLFHNAGLHRIESTSMGNLFSFYQKDPLQNHGNAIGAWGKDIAHPDARITVTKIKDSSDIHAITRAVNKDHMQQMAKHVMIKAKDLNNPDEIRQLAKNRFMSLQATPAKSYASLHKQAGIIDDEVDRFMRAFKYNKSTGIATLQFSPLRKPLPLIGGFNANINYQRYKGQSLQSLMKRRGLGKLSGPDLRPWKVRTNFLYTDPLDLAKGARWVQKNPHMTYYNGTNVLEPYVSTRKATLDAIKGRKWEKAFKNALRLAKKVGSRAARFAVFKR
tara:strand:- start:1350 stop:2834 length:1485 start_codon:yes stop_codon:yes gene_type:complete